MAARTTEILTVIKKRQLTPNMTRITVGGSNLDKFPPGHESGYVKLMFENDSDLPVDRNTEHCCRYYRE